MSTLNSVVLIDDNPLWRETLADFLEGKGFSVQETESAEPGLSLLTQGPVQVAIVDFQMPGMNGLELLQAVKGSGKHIAILMLSSEDDPALPEQALEEGARAFLSKNLAPRELLRQLLHALQAAEIEIALVAVLSQTFAPCLPGPSTRTLYLPAPQTVEQN